MAISPYVAEIRELIGTRRLLLPSACVIPRDDAGRILLVRQEQNGKFETVGGSIEPDESPDEAAPVAAKEEAGVDVEVELVAALGGPEFIATYPNGDRTKYLSIVFDRWSPAARR